jgi:hypothetical protein
MTSLVVPSITDEFVPTHPNFRSKICRHWLKGYCNRGRKCNFAHGFSEVKSKRNHSSVQRTRSMELVHKMENGFENMVYNPLEGLVDGYEIIYKDSVVFPDDELLRDNNIVLCSSSDEGRSSPEYIDV